MIEAVALGPKGAVYSAMRMKGASHVIAHDAKRATSLYSTKDQLRAMWVSASGVIHAAGKRHHTNLGGEWRSAKLGGEPIFGMWGSADDDVIAGSRGGELLRLQGGKWIEIAKLPDTIYAVHGTAQDNVVVGGEGVFARYDGAKLAPIAKPAGVTCLHGLVADGDELWFCSPDRLFRQGAKGKAVRVAELDDGSEMYAIGIGKAGVFVQSVGGVRSLAGKRLVEVELEAAAVSQARTASYSTSMTSNGQRVVAGGVRSVLVNDGKGFVEWPAPV
jgi:hypothetical protein